MAMTGPTTALPTISTGAAAIDDADDETPGWLSRSIRQDPVRAVAILLILIQLLWRAKISSAGFMAYDDFQLAIEAHENGLTVDYLLSHFNNHMMPAGLLYVWAVTKAFGYAYWPYLLILLLGQAVLSVAFFRLLRQLTSARWGVLVPLSVFLFSPLNLEVTAWWVFGMFMLPLQLAMVWAIGAQVKYVRTGQKRHLVSLALSLVFGLLFAEKALLIAPLLFVLTACLLVKGSPGRSIWRAITRYWPAWLVLTAVSVPYLLVYRINAESSLRKPDSVSQVTSFFGQLFGETLIPGLLGGPWSWLFGAGPPLAAPEPVLYVLALVIMAALVAFTIWRRPPAGRAWLLLLAYAFVAAALIASSRLGFALSSVAGLVPRYTSDIVVVAAICIGVATFGVRDVPDRKPPRQIRYFATPAGGMTKIVAITAAVFLYAVGTVVSTSGFSKAWAVQPGRDYLVTVQAELAKAPAGTVFFEQVVPDDVLVRYSYPINMQSRFFGPLALKPVFVTEAEKPSVFDDKGHIRPAWVDGRKSLPGPVPQCGHAVKGIQSVSIPLDGPLIYWPWTVRMAYLSSAESTVAVRIGGQVHQFVAKQGLHQIFFNITGSGETVDITVLNQGVDFCTNDIAVGKLVPWML